MKDIIKTIETSKIISIIRGIDTQYMEQVVNALIIGGINMVEITMNTPNALDSIKKIKSIFGDKLCIGAGTVLDKSMAEAAIASGAQFLISPNLDKEVIEVAIANNVLPIPGVMTPTEMVNAVKCGASIIKLFPASQLGPSYVKDVLAPLNNVKIIAVGGICLDNAKLFIRAGAVGLGVGGNLVNKSLVEKKDFYSITYYAKQLIESLI